MLNKFFEGLKVVELASVLAGPAVGMFFAELGAEVIKIENKTSGGDVTRKWKLPQENKDNEIAAYYYSINWNKETHLINLHSEEGRQKVYDWIRTADIVISNFKLSSAKKMKMDYESISAINDKIIYAQLTAFGEEVEAPAFDVVLQAEAGFLYMCGEAERAPVKMPVALIDILAAHQLKEAILIALLNKAQKGKGAYVSTSLLEAAIASLANQATNWLMVGHVPQRMGSMHPNIAPYGDIFHTLDKKTIVLAIGTDRQFQQLSKALGIGEIAKEERFESNINRVQNRVELKEELKAPIAKYNRVELMEIFRENGIPAGSIRNMKEVFELPMAQSMILEEVHKDQSISKRVKTVAFQLKPKNT